MSTLSPLPGQKLTYLISHDIVCHITQETISNQYELIQEFSHPSDESLCTFNGGVLQNNIEGCRVGKKV